MLDCSSVVYQCKYVGLRADRLYGNTLICFAVQCGRAGR